MTNLLFANCGIPLLSTYSSSLTGTGIDSLFGGTRADYFRVTTATSGDERLTFTAAAPTTANFLYIGKANLLKYGSVGTVTLKGHTSNSYGAATTVYSDASFASATLRGPSSEDYIATFPTSSAFQYWYLNLNATGASKFPMSKVFFGQYLDFGMDPNAPIAITRTRPTAGRRTAAYTFRLSYQGLPYAKTVTLYNDFYRARAYNPVLLFTTSYHHVLMGSRVVFGRITDMTMPPRVTDFNDVELEVEEMP